MKARIAHSLRLIQDVNASRLAGDRAAADSAQATLDAYDRFNGYDRRRNLDLGKAPQPGEKLHASTPGQLANPGWDGLRRYKKHDTTTTGEH